MGPTKSFFAIFVLTKDFCLPLAVCKVVDVFHAFKSFSCANHIEEKYLSIIDRYHKYSEKLNSFLRLNDFYFGCSTMLRVETHKGF